MCWVLMARLMVLVPEVILLIFFEVVELLLKRICNDKAINVDHNQKKVLDPLHPYVLIYIKV